jgi:hypothetical protein
VHTADSSDHKSPATLIAAKWQFVGTNYYKSGGGREREGERERERENRIDEKCST